MTKQDKRLREIGLEIVRLEAKIENLIPDEQKYAEQRSTALLRWHTWALTDDELRDAQDAHAAVAIPLGEAHFELEKTLDERQSLIERRDKLAKEAE